MQAFYYTKADLFGIKKGHVEMFQEHAAARLLREGVIEPFDVSKHGSAPGARDAAAFALACGIEPIKTSRPIK